MASPIGLLVLGIVVCLLVASALMFTIERVSHNIAQRLPRIRTVHVAAMDGELALFLRCIQSTEVDSYLYIVTGEANPGGYTADIGQALIDAAQKRNVDVRIVMGAAPFLDPKGFNVVIDRLSQCNGIRIRVLPRRPQHHFRVSGSIGVYYEFPHFPDDDERRVIVSMDQEDRDIYRLWFDQLFDTAQPFGREAALLSKRNAPILRVSYEHRQRVVAGAKFASPASVGPYDPEQVEAWISRSADMAT